MKKIFLSILFAVMTTLAFNNSVKASITIDFYLQITDNHYCGPPNYTGNYHITVIFQSNGEPVCQHDFYNVSISPNNPHITWECNVEWDQYNNHSVRITVCHWNPLTGDSCCDDAGLGTHPMDYFTSGNTYPITIN